MIKWRNRAVCLLCGLLPLYMAQTQAQKRNIYWQQEVKYEMDVVMDVQNHKFTGRQILKYKNNSPDILEKVFFHLYLNAFQPGSAMDVRSQYLPDPDPRIGDRIGSLSPEDIGYQEIQSLKQNGKPLKFETAGTILEVTLAEPIRPGGSTRFEMVYEAQVPIQIRRTGRDNKEGIRYSMSQWYPKLCEYDARGWHAHPYIAREFYGVWGDYDVRITIDPNYILGAGGVLINASEVGYGYSSKTTSSEKPLTWHFKAKNVHDFVWAADPGYTHDQHVCRNGVVLHALYNEKSAAVEPWKKLLPIMEEAMLFMNEHYGNYAYPVYSFIQGGDGGMEYPMATLITGNRSLVSLVGVSVHELVHSWYQMMFGFNESYYYWMDEGFTDYVGEKVMEHLKAKKLIPGDPNPDPYVSTYRGYSNLIQSGFEEPLSTHADHFEFNSSYSIAAYVKGAVFLHQLEYIIGKPAIDRGMLQFYDTWKFKHPDANAFIRVMEKVSGLELDWYLDYMVYSTKYIDYAIDTMGITGPTARGGSIIPLRRDGLMPMPLDIELELKDGQRLYYTIPLDIMRGSKTEKAPNGKDYTLLPDWNWVNTTYVFAVPNSADQIQRVRIDPSGRLADQAEENNQWPLPDSN